MNEETARAVAAGSVGLTVLGVGMAVLFCTKESRVRLRNDVVLLAVTVLAIAGMAIATRVHTNAALVVLAVLAGSGLGFVQGRRLDVRRDGDRLFARRGALSLAAWGGGMVITQAASIASRTEAMELGQAVSYFGAGAALGLIFGRQGPLKQSVSRPAGAAAAISLIAASVGAVCLMAPQPATAQGPEVVTITAKVDPGALLVALDKLGAGASAGESEIEFAFPATGGNVAGTGQAVIEGFHLGILVAIFEGLGSAIGEGVFGGGDSGGSGSDAVNVRPELANCRANYVGKLTLSGTFTAGTGAMSGPAEVVFVIADPKGCPAELKDMVSAELSRLAGTWKATFDGQSLQGAVSVADGANSMSLPFTAKAAKEEPTPVLVAGSAGAIKPPGPSGGDGDGAGDDSRAPGLGGDDEIVTTEEAAGAGIVGAVAAAIAAAIAGLTSAGAAASGAAAGLVGATGGAPQAPSGGPQRPRRPGAITEENLDTAAANIIKRAETLGETGLAGRMESLVTTGELTPEQAERFREALKRREGLATWMASDDLYTKSDAQALAEGMAKDGQAGLDKLGAAADFLGQPGVGAMLRNPGTTARVAAAIASGGATEIAATGIDIANKIYTEATSPGENLTNFGAGAAMTKIIGWEVGKEVVMDKLGGKVMEGLGAAGKSLAPGLFGDGLGAATKSVPPASAMDEGVEALVKSGDDAAGALAKSGDEAAGVAAKSGDEAAGVAAKSGEEAATESAARNADGPPKTEIKPPATPPEAPATPNATALAPKPELGPAPTPKVDPVPHNVDNTWLKDSPHGTPIPKEKIAQTGWTPDEAESIRRVAEDNNAAIGARTTNIDGLAHPHANPKIEDVKGKTITPEDIPLGARPSDKGLAATFPPQKPPADAPPAVQERFRERAEEWNQLSPKLKDLREKGVFWDPKTGLMVDKDGIPFKGDIDLVYVRDLEGNDIVGERLAKIKEELEAAARTQHGAETGIVRDVAAAGGDVDKAAALQQRLSASHMPAGPSGSAPAAPGGALAGNEGDWGVEGGGNWETEAGGTIATAPARETVIETTASGWVKGAQPRSIEQRVGGPNPLEGGLPRQMPDGTTEMPDGVTTFRDSPLPGDRQ